MTVVSLELGRPGHAFGASGYRSGHERRVLAIASALTYPTWVVATALGFVGGEFLPDPRALGLDVVFPAVMGALAVVPMIDRRALIAAVAGALVGLAVALLVQPSVGVMAGGLAGPLIAMLVPASPAARTADMAPDGMPG